MIFIYKKVSSLSKDEMNEQLQHTAESKFTRFVYVSDKEHYINEMMKYVELDNQVLETDPVEYTRENLEESWNRHHQERIAEEERVNNFCENDDATVDDFFDVLKSFVSPATYQYHLYDGELYYVMFTNNNFRCYVNSENPLRSYEETISFLESINDDSDPYRLQFYTDVNGVRDVITGLSDELKDWLKDLFKNNDVIIDFC